MLIFVTILALASANAQVKKELPPLNAKVVEFSKSCLGEMVGNGECSTLAVEALKASGAKRFPFARDGDYVWGEPVASFKDALPGDIVQFRNAVFQGRSRPNSRGITTYWHYEFAHHTAIIQKVQERGQKVTFLHQNTGGEGVSEQDKRKVKQQTLRVDSLQPGGRIWIYRPMSPDLGPVGAKQTSPGQRPG